MFEKMFDLQLSFFKSTKKAIYEAKQQKKSIRNKRIKRIKIVRNIEDIRLKRLIEKQSELHQYRVKGVKIGARFQCLSPAKKYKLGVRTIFGPNVERC